MSTSPVSASPDGPTLTPTGWIPNGGDDHWNTPENWTAGVPTLTHEALLDSPFDAALIDASVISGVCSSLSVGATKQKPCRLEITGGSLVVQDGELNVGAESGSVGVVVMSDGHVDLKGKSTGLGRLNVGRDGIGTLSINGGKITVQDGLNIPLNPAGAGHLNLHGGRIACSRFTMRQTGGSGTMDITRGTLVIDGDVTSMAGFYASNRWITAYDGNGIVESGFDPASLKTTIRAKSDDIIDESLDLSTESATILTTDGTGSDWVIGTEKNRFILQSGDAALVYHLKQGWADYYWKNRRIIRHLYSAVRLPAYVTSKAYQHRTYAIRGAEVMVTCSSDDFPTMKQHFIDLGDGRFLIQVEMEGTNLSSNWMAPVQVAGEGAIDIGVVGDNRVLRAPWDNSEHERYHALPMNSTNSGWNVLALYDNDSRQGLILGSVTHDTWKTGTEYSGSENLIDFLRVYGGARQIQDVMPHGDVRGNNLFSPKVFLGYFADWREGMFAYTDACLAIAPKLPLPAGDNGGIPMAWKTGGGKSYALGTRTDFEKAEKVSRYIHKTLQPREFYNDKGTVYLTLDGGVERDWLPDELTTWANNCVERGQKVGSYFTPFKVGGAPDRDLQENAVTVTERVPAGDTSPGSTTTTALDCAQNTYTYYDIILKDSAGDPIIDGDKYALDPTHPGTKQLIRDQLLLWKTAGFHYFRADFIILGALEGDHFAGPGTGMQAYNEGMQYILNTLKEIDHEMHIDLGVSPVFPYQYAHSKRICNDVHDEIQDTAYQLNATAYGCWWLARLYSFPDPGSCSFIPEGYDEDGAGPKPAQDHDPYEARSRVIAVTINAGLVRNENNLLDDDQTPLVEANLTRPEVMNVARLGKCFQPVESNTGSYAPYSYVLAHEGAFYIAVFNFGPGEVDRSVSLARAGLSDSRPYRVTDLWSEETFEAEGTLSLRLLGREGRLFSLEPINRAPTFKAASFTMPDAVKGRPYAGTLAGSATDPDLDAPLTFARVWGPAWLSVAPDGALSGTPAKSDKGINEFGVRVTDPGGLYNDATMVLNVHAPE